MNIRVGPEPGLGFVWQGAGAKSDVQGLLRGITSNAMGKKKAREAVILNKVRGMTCVGLDLS